MYIVKGRVLTTVNTIKPMPVSTNDMSDLNIIRRKEIYRYVSFLHKDLVNKI